MNLICACCGALAPARHQWHNQDAGHGICRPCWERLLPKYGIEEMIRLYGAPGIHHSTQPSYDPAAAPQLQHNRVAWRNATKRTNPIQGALEMLREAAKQFRCTGDNGHAVMCDRHADELAKLNPTPPLKTVQALRLSENFNESDM